MKKETGKGDFLEELCGKPLDNELEQINRFTRRNLSENEVYVFSVVLCDNEIDRDFERFSVESLKSLEKLFVGVTGIFDHNPESKNQSARIFSCRLESVKDKLTSDGQPYYRLCARAYMPISDSNRDFILELDSGIKKEVSVGCAVRKRICSVCGEDIYGCEHIKGRKYGKKLCYATLDGVSDAYEWSFVAVPAQKGAGVIKSYKNGGKKLLDIEKRLLTGEEQTFTAEEVKTISEKIRTLTEKAHDGELYRRQLAEDVRKYASVVFPEISGESLESVAENMTVEQLKEFRSAFEKKAMNVLPLKPQLFKENSTQKNNNTLYKNI
ncbi:MAG: hypothetical protein ACI4XP_01985 [Acutalibacteraceae bacterium]